MKLTKGLHINHILLQVDLLELSETSHCRAAWSRQSEILGAFFFFLTSLLNLSFNISPQIVVVLVVKSCPILVTPWTVALQAFLSMGFSRQEHWSGLPFPSPGDLPKPGIEPQSPAWQADSVMGNNSLTNPILKIISGLKK